MVEKENLEEKSESFLIYRRGTCWSKNLLQFQKLYRGPPPNLKSGPNAGVRASPLQQNQFCTIRISVTTSVQYGAKRLYLQLKILLVPVC